MSEGSFTESVVEDAALAWLENLGYAIKHGPDISPVGDTLTLALSQREREDYSEVIPLGSGCGKRLCGSILLCQPRRSTTPFEKSLVLKARPSTRGIGRFIGFSLTVLP